MEKNQSAFEVGDEVTISIEDIDVIVQMQVNHGGWNENMKECMKGVCIVRQEFMFDYIISGPSGRKYKINSDLLSKYVPKEYKVGEKVTITKDKERMIQIQEGHGGWLDSMEVLCGETVEIVERKSNGDYNIKKNIQTWILNPACFVATCNTKQTSAFKIGDKIQILKDKSKVKNLQKIHGEWDAGLQLFLGLKGKVERVYPDGDLEVKVIGTLVKLNPECVKKVDGDPDIEIDFSDVITICSQLSKISEGVDVEDLENTETLREISDFMKTMGSLPIDNIIASSGASQTEVDELKLKVKNLEDEKICSICYDRPINCTFDCGHVSCQPCAEKLFECHICRTPLEKLIKTFR